MCVYIYIYHIYIYTEESPRRLLGLGLGLRIIYAVGVRVRDYHTYIPKKGPRRLMARATARMETVDMVKYPACR